MENPVQDFVIKIGTKEPATDEQLDVLIENVVEELENFVKAVRERCPIALVKWDYPN